jgi:hypothetical protein
LIALFNLSTTGCGVPAGALLESRDRKRRPPAPEPKTLQFAQHVFDVLLRGFGVLPGKAGRP